MNKAKIFSALLLVAIMVTPAAYAQTNTERLQNIQSTTNLIHDIVTGITASYTELQSTIASLQSDVTSILTGVITIQSGVTDIHTDVDAIHTEVTSMHTDVDTIHTIVSNIQNTPDGLSTQDVRAAVAAEILPTLQAIQNRIAQIESEVASTKIMQTQIHALVQSQKQQPTTIIINNTAPTPAPTPYTGTTATPGTTLIQHEVTHGIKKSDLTRGEAVRWGGVNDVHHLTSIGLTCDKDIYPTSTSMAFGLHHQSGVPSLSNEHGTEYIQVTVGGVTRDIYNSYFLVSADTAVALHKTIEFSDSVLVPAGTAILYSHKTQATGAALGGSGTNLPDDSVIYDMTMQYRSYYGTVNCTWGGYTTSGSPTTVIPADAKTKTILYGIPAPTVSLVEQFSHTVQCTKPADITYIDADTVPHPTTPGLSDFNRINIGNDIVVQFAKNGTSTIVGELPLRVDGNATISGDKLQGLILSMHYRSAGTCAIS